MAAPSASAVVPRLSGGERLAITGRTGSGKTYLTRWTILRSPLNWIVLDTKHDPEFDEWRPIERLLTPRMIGRLWRDRRIIVLRPRPDENAPARLDAFINMLHASYDNFGLCLDEMYQICGPNAVVREGLTGLLTRGRVRKQAVIMGTQRPARVPLTMYSEADYIVSLHLTLPKDRARVGEYMGGRDGMIAALAPRYWLMFDVKRNTGVAYRPVTIT